MLTAVDSALLSALRPGGTLPLAVALPSLAVGSRRGGGKQRLFRRGFRDLERAWSKMDDCFGSCRNHPILAGVRAGKQDGDSFKGEFRTGYHPLEDIEELAPSHVGEERRLSDAETARTIIEVNRKATAIFSGFIDEEVQENIVWPDLSYLTDEHGDVYFEVNNEREILHSMITDDKFVKVVIGLDNIEMLAEMEVSATPDLDFRLEEIISDEDDEDDADDVYEEDVMTILEEVDELLSAGNESGWTNLETMQACHPMYFAEKMSEAISRNNLDWMDQPPASIVIQGHLRPVFVEESINKKKLPYNGVSDTDQILQKGSSFYKLDIITMQIFSSYGNQLTIKIQDYHVAQPDILAHCAENIISRLKAGGEKIFEALQLLCMKQKGINVEEAVVIGIDSHGFDLRVCAGKQVQTLRFAFETRATSEFSAERQLNNLLFPRTQRKQQRWQQAHQIIDG